MISGIRIELGGKLTTFEENVKSGLNLTECSETLYF